MSLRTCPRLSFMVIPALWGLRIMPATPGIMARDTEVTYDELAKRLKRHGLKETKASITLARGTFPATFFLACIAALELEGVALDEI